MVVNNALGCKGQLLKAAWACLLAMFFVSASSALAQPNLRCISFSVDETSANFGDNITVSFQVENTGTTDYTYTDVQLYISTDADIDPAVDTPVDSDLFIWGLASGEVFNLWASIARKLPDGTDFFANGTVYIGAVVDVNEDLAESDETDNRNRGLGIDMDTITLSPPPGMDLTGFDGRDNSQTALQDFFFDVDASNAYWGSTIGLKAAVFNQGQTDITQPFEAHVYISQNSGIVASQDVKIFTLSFPNGLASLGIAGQTDYIPVLLPATNPFPGASYVHIGMIVDGTNVVTEYSELNNRNMGEGIDKAAGSINGRVYISEPDPDITVLPEGSGSSLDFGAVANDGGGGATETKTVVITNPGPAFLTVSDISIGSGSAFSIKSVASNLQNVIVPYTTHPIRWSGEESWIVTLEFDPEANGSHSGTLVVDSDDPDEASVLIPLLGSGVPVPDLFTINSSDPGNDRELDFGGVINDGAGGVSASLTMLLGNSGSGSLEVSAIALLTGTYFTIDSIVSNTQGTVPLPFSGGSIAPASVETWTVSLTFDPAITGQIDDALVISSDDQGETTVNVALRGSGQLPGDIEVTDSLGVDDDLALTFGGVHADGAGLQFAEATVSINNVGEADLTVPVNGLMLDDGSHFSVISVLSDVGGVIEAVDLSSEAGILSGDGEETWIVTLRFDPAAAGNLVANLSIQSDDPDENPLTVALSGIGLDEADIEILDGGGSALPLPLILDFGATLNDSAGDRVATRSFRLRNVGTQPLTIDLDGLVLAAGNNGSNGNAQGFALLSVESSIDGVVDLSASDPAGRVISPVSAEDWTVVVSFDPDADAAFADTLQVRCNDPDEASSEFALSGTGVRPVILSVLDGVIEQNISAGSVFELSWSDEYAGGNAMVNLYYDSDTDPSSGLVAIASNISEDDESDVFLWRPDAALAGTTVWIYASASDGAVTQGAYAAVPLHIEAEGAFRLLSPIKVTSKDYAYEYEYLGQTYSGVTTLAAGQTVVTVTTDLAGGGSVVHTFKVDLVDSLLDETNVTYDDLQRVKTVTNGNGITTTFIYDVMGRLVKTESDNGRVVTWEFDVLGRRLKMQDYTGTTFYDWDDLDRLTAIYSSEDDEKGNADDLVLQYSGYDLAGRLLEMIYPSGEIVRYTYDDGGRMLTVEVPNRSLTWTYEYDYTRGGLLTSITYPNQFVTEYSYNDDADLIQIVHKDDNGALVEKYDYVINASGYATEFSTSTGEVSFKKEKYFYDDQDRIEKVIYSQEDAVIEEGIDLTVVYLFDETGNRISEQAQESGAVIQDFTYKYGSENRLLEVKNLVSGIQTFYEYDTSGNRTSVKRLGQKIHEYDYDERNFCVRLDGKLMEYNGDAQIAEYSDQDGQWRIVADPRQSEYEIVSRNSGSDIKLNVFGRAKLCEITNDGIEYFFFDRSRTLRFSVDDTGGVSAAPVLDVYGKLLQ